MNKQLTQQIIIHIFTGLGLLSKLGEQFNSLRSKDYLLSEKLTFVDEDGEVKKNIWGVQSFLENESFKILVTDCTTNTQTLDYAMIVHLKNNPTYGLYLNLDKDDFSKSNSLISVSLDGKSWAQCNVYLQATFLAAMESVKDFSLNWKKSQNHKEEYDSLVSFVKHYDNIFQENEVNEG